MRATGAPSWRRSPPPAGGSAEGPGVEPGGPLGRAARIAAWSLAVLTPSLEASVLSSAARGPSGRPVGALCCWALPPGGVAVVVVVELEPHPAAAPKRAVVP